MSQRIRRQNWRDPWPPIDKLLPIAATPAAAPRSGAGRKRSGRNSFRHGLAAAATATAERSKRIERLARNIAGASIDVVTLECARTIAEAEFDLAQIRRAQVELISHVMAFGEAKRSPTSHVVREVNRALRAFDRGELVRFDGLEPPALPTKEPERTAEAMRRALPELIMLDRYERRAAGRRARALRRFLECKNTKNNL